MKLLPELAGIAVALVLAAEGGAAALPFSDAYLQPNQQIKPVDVALDGSNAALILLGGGFHAEAGGRPYGAGRMRPLA